MNLKSWRLKVGGACQKEAAMPAGACAEVDPNTVGICHCTNRQTLTGMGFPYKRRFFLVSPDGSDWNLIQNWNPKT